MKKPNQIFQNRKETEDFVTNSYVNNEVQIYNIMNILI